MEFEIVGSSADFMPKRALWKRIKDLSPVWFVKTSLSFMKGHPRSYVWKRMLPHYIRYARETLKR